MRIHKYFPIFGFVVFSNFYDLVDIHVVVDFSLPSNYRFDVGVHLSVVLQASYIKLPSAAPPVDRFCHCWRTCETSFTQRLLTDLCQNRSPVRFPSKSFACHFPDEMEFLLESSEYRATLFGVGDPMNALSES